MKAAAILAYVLFAVGVTGAASPSPVPARNAQGAWGVPAVVAPIAFNPKATNQDGTKNASALRFVAPGTRER